MVEFRERIWEKRLVIFPIDSILLPIAPKCLNLSAFPLVCTAWVKQPEHGEDARLTFVSAAS